ncbi:unnamed protein product [Meganyctiphanes norvegica]|uniref:Uncharacterized protein n=1 Tax=Meganyctiphanes norvegica TaxID=48144 RepID=A0AAV2QG13_MEGNR
MITPVEFGHNLLYVVQGSVSKGIIGDRSFSAVIRICRRWFFAAMCEINMAFWWYNMMYVGVYVGSHRCAVLKGSVPVQVLWCVVGVRLRPPVRLCLAVMVAAYTA